MEVIMLKEGFLLSVRLAGNIRFVYDHPDIIPKFIKLLCQKKSSVNAFEFYEYIKYNIAFDAPTHGQVQVVLNEMLDLISKVFGIYSM